MAKPDTDVTITVSLDVDTSLPVTGLDVKLAAVAMAEADGETDFNAYIPRVEALIKLGWRPMLVDVTGKRPTAPVPFPRGTLLGHSTTRRPWNSLERSRESAQTQLRSRLRSDASV